MKAFSSILAHLAHLACAFSLILNRINKLMFWFKHANTRKHVSEQSWLSGWIILIILAHLAHLAQSYFSLIFSAINTYNCFWFHLINEKNFSHWRSPLLVSFRYWVKQDNRKQWISSSCDPKLFLNTVSNTTPPSFFPHIRPAIYGLTQPSHIQ